MKKLEDLFKVYSDHGTRVKGYAEILWSEIDIKQMTADVETTLEHLRSLNHLKSLPLFSKIEKEIIGFAESLPLMRVLKSEAIRYDRSAKRV